jgi:hypothetical protein
MSLDEGIARHLEVELAEGAARHLLVRNGCSRAARGHGQHLVDDDARHACIDQAQNTSVNTPAAQRNPDGFHVVLSPVYSIR